METKVYARVGAFKRADRQIDITPLDRRHDIVETDLSDTHLIRVELHPDRVLLRTKDVDLSDSTHH